MAAAAAQASANPSVLTLLAVIAATVAVLGGGSVGFLWLAERRERHAPGVHRATGMSAPEPLDRDHVEGPRGSL